MLEIVESFSKSEGKVYGEYPCLNSCFVQVFARSSGKLDSIFLDCGADSSAQALAIAIAVAKSLQGSRKSGFTVSLDYDDDDLAVAGVSYRAIMRPPYRPHNVIRVAHGLQSLMLDLATIVVCQRKISDAFSTSVLGPAFRHEEVQNIIAHSLEAYVLERRKWSVSKQSTSILQSYRCDAHASIGKFNKDLATWREMRIGGLRFTMLFFAMAHEIGHIVHGHLKTREDPTLIQELEADAFAAKMLHRFSLYPPSWWEFVASNDGLDTALITLKGSVGATVFAQTGKDVNAERFTNSMSDLAEDARLHWNERKIDGVIVPSNAILSMTDNLNAVACVFSAFEGAERVDRHRERRIRGNYPSARERWEAFRVTYGKQDRAPEGIFTEQLFGAIGTPEETFSFLQALVDRVASGKATWKS